MADINRSYFADQLADPLLRDRLFALTQAEVGGQGPDAQQAFLETVLNRAASRQLPLMDTMSLNNPRTGEGYYPSLGNPGALSDAQRAFYGNLLTRVMAGSDITGGATGNASGTVGFAGGPMTARIGGEKFGIEGPDMRTPLPRFDTGLPMLAYDNPAPAMPGLPVEVTQGSSLTPNQRVAGAFDALQGGVPAGAVPRGVPGIASMPTTASPASGELPMMPQEGGVGNWLNNNWLTLLALGGGLASGGIGEGLKQAATIGFGQKKLAQDEAQTREALALRRAGLDIERQKLNQPVVVSPGGSVVDRGTGRVIYSGQTDATLDDATLDQMATQYRAGDTSVMTNLGRGVQGAANVVALRKRIQEQTTAAGETGRDRALSNAEYFGEKSGQRTLGTRQANIEMAAQEFKQVVPIVAEASRAVDRTNYPNLNKIIQAWQEGTGDPNIVKFGGGLNTLVNLYARAINPTGTPTVSDKDHARGILQKAWSQGQFDAAVSMMQAEIDAALTSPEKVREEMRRRFGGSQSAPASAPAAPVAGGVIKWELGPDGVPRRVQQQ